MKISVIGITGILFVIFFILHIVASPDLKTIGFELASMWYFQLWFYTFMATFLLVADIFYVLLKNKK
jgi:hypothetical protein